MPREDKRQLVKYDAANRVERFSPSNFPSAILAHCEIANERIGARLSKATLAEIADEIKRGDSRYA
jgi:hypothetical protein